MSSLTATPPKDRPIYKRMTIMAGATFAVLAYLESEGLIPPGQPAAIKEFVSQVVLPVLGGLGLYRHIPTT